MKCCSLNIGGAIKRLSLITDPHSVPDRCQSNSEHYHLCVGCNCKHNGCSQCALPISLNNNKEIPNQSSTATENISWTWRRNEDLWRGPRGFGWTHIKGLARKIFWAEWIHWKEIWIMVEEKTAVGRKKTGLSTHICTQMTNICNYFCQRCF